MRRTYEYYSHEYCHRCTCICEYNDVYSYLNTSRMCCTQMYMQRDSDSASVRVDAGVDASASAESLVR